MRIFIIFLIFVSTSTIAAVNIGFNQAWIKNSYAHQWINYDGQEFNKKIVKTE